MINLIGRTRSVWFAIAGVVVALVAGYLVWIAGLDAWWAATTVLVLLPVAALFAISTFSEPLLWPEPVREPPRGIRLTVTTIEQSLAACDRLARPPILRRLRELSVAERDDKQARAIVRQMRALLIVALRDRGLDASRDVEQIAATLGTDALTILQPDQGEPITSAMITRTLSAIERLASTPLPPR